MRDSPATLPIAAESLRRKHEAPEPRLRNTLIIAVCVVVMTVVCLVVSRIALDHLARRRLMQPTEALGLVSAPNLAPLARFPKPNLEMDDGHADSTALREQQIHKLTSYGWVDRSNGVMRIPIERAIILVAERGLPVDTNSAGTNLSPLQLIQRIPTQRQR